MADQPKLIIVHSLDQAILALRVAKDMHKPVLLQNAPDAIHYCGSLYLRDLFRRAFEAVPETKADYILDCADSPGFALGALADGHKRLRLSAPAEIAEKMDSIARQSGAQLTTQKTHAIDLLHQADPEAAIRAWLK